MDQEGAEKHIYTQFQISSVLLKEKKVLNVAWSGIAATLLRDGRTVHNAFKLPVPTNYEGVCSSISKDSEEGKLLRSIDIIIWDEAPMASKYALDAINSVLQFVMGNKVLFGGKCLILGGDFRQCLPIIKSRVPMDSVTASIKFSNCWNNSGQF
ncbi:MAG: putative ATP-dependent DNA helicase PIF1 [Streblomastix strix]|uniref:ATP-dependent DNA helicase n=1 Tax=Streblomastix strix TaxID=222440 RepID=A0A5J4UUC0_9EUKA|nr:MAG: putative ATP-dependent DNA helicase PIF1 [Streblomastix strix]